MRIWALGLVGIALFVGCKRKTAPADECAAACAAAGCTPKEECQKACDRTKRESAAGGCDARYADYLRCVGKSGQKFDGQGSLLCGSGAEASECKSVREAFESCGGDCAHAGAEELMKRNVSGADIETRVVKNGCVACTDVLAKAPGGGAHGTPCTSHSVCATACCGCDDSPGTFSVQSCVNGQCQLGDAACVTARNLRGEMQLCSGPSSVPTVPDPPSAEGESSPGEAAPAAGSAAPIHAP
jgi:hypothetical protein